MSYSLHCHVQMQLLPKFTSLHFELASSKAMQGIDRSERIKADVCVNNINLLKLCWHAPGRIKCRGEGALFTEDKRFDFVLFLTMSAHFLAGQSGIWLNWPSNWGDRWTPKINIFWVYLSNHSSQPGAPSCTVLIRYCDYHPVTKSPKIGCFDYFSNVPNVRLVL